MSTIVISGFSGRFPECDNVDELREKLFAGEDLITEDARRWIPGLHGLPRRNGKLKDLAGFDAKFFGVHPRQANAMDPGLRILLENTYEAIVDAGYNPEELRGKKIGVYVGQTFGEALDNLSRDPETLVGYGMSGANRAMTSNRISFTFDFRGPSYTVDTACSSSLFALDQAVKAMEEGHISAALVGGVNILLSTSTSLYFHRLNMLSDDGACKAFDASGRGYVRSEATGMLFLQKYEDARRVYATVVKTGTNADGYKDQGITYPSGASQKTLIEDVFRSIDVRPSQVSYVEAHGTGTKAGDPEEMNTVDSVFCAEPRATGPLLVGSVKSNMGHSEGSAGICQVAKVLIAMEEGAIPQTLHFKEPNPSISGLANGNLQVVDKNLPWSGGYAAMNSFGFGGANAHVLLKSHDKKKISHQKTKLPKIVTCSGTTQEAVSSLLARANQYKEDDELVGLLHATYRRNISAHSHRGFSILGKTEDDIEDSTTKREVWFVFSGMGSQWSGMGRRLTVFQPFARGLEKCADALRTVGVDLMDIINNCDESSLHVLNSFISITSIQVALVDLLTALGVRPDGMVGHSVGELGCAYADGTFTAEQAVLAAHARGKSILDCKLPVGAMAAVAGLSWDEVKSELPADVFAACNNAVDSVTISGEAHAVEKCVVDLKSRGINVREVNSSGVGFHSKCIAPAGPALRKALMEIVPDPKPRSSKWISTCVPESSWNETWARSSSAEYHTHNLLSPVLFKEGMEKIPAGSLVIEIAPHALLSGLLRKSINGSHVVPLTKKGIPDEVNFLLNSLGRIYNAGVALDLAMLYPKVEFPVGRSTPMIAPAIKWDHTTQWHVPLEEQGKGSVGFIKEVDLKKDDAFIHGHTIDGRVLYPATGYLVLVWKAFAKKLGRTFESLQVEIEDVHLHQATILSQEGSVKLAVSILQGSGEFELTQGNSVLVTGRIKESAGLGETCSYTNRKKNVESKIQLSSDDVYKELRLRGYEYTGEFQGVTSSDIDGVEGLLEWSGNWITFIDTMLQFDIIGKRTRELFLPTRFTKIVIDPLKHLELAKQKRDFQVYSNKNLSMIRSGGVEIRNLKTSHVRRRVIQQKPKHEEHVFVPYINNKTMTRENALTAALQIVMENMESSLKIKILELGRSGNVLCPTVGSILKNQPSVIADITLATKLSPEEIVGLPNDVKLISKDFRSALESGGHNLLMSASLLTDNHQLLTKVAQSMKNATFLLCEERIGVNGRNVDKSLELISKFDTGESSVFVYRQVRKWMEPDLLHISNKHFKWVSGIRNWLKENRGTNKNLLVVSQGEPHSGVLGLIRCLRLEDNGKSIRSLMLPDEKGDLILDQYVDQLKKDLCMNVFRDGAWGSMRHLSIDQNVLNRVSTQHAYVNTLVRGDLSSLEWIQGPLTHYRKHLNPGKELCSIYYAPLNFRDIMLATGKLPPDALPGNLTGQECILGLEFSGRDSAGRRVMGIVEACGLATTVAADEGFLWSVPPSWSLEQAATVPIVYATAYYALIVRGKLRSGESVLVHAGSGGVGLAAISIALHLGCQVFTTVGSPQKRAFLKENFPQLSDSVICNSRDSSFEQKVLSQTGGQGVDVVLNSLAGELLQSSVRCLAKQGRFLEIGKADLSNNTPLGMSVFLRNTAVHGILLDALFAAGKDDPEKAAVVQLMREGIESGQVQPLPATVFKRDQIEQSFRYMATGKHIGKVVLQIREEEKRTVFEPRKHLVPAIARSYMDPDKSYLLVGGLGGFGLELADWLVNRGANKLVLTSRSGVTTGYQALRVQRWRERGVLVKVSTADCTTGSGAVELMKTAALMGPVGGIYNLAGVLQDAMMEEQSEESFSTVASPKMDGTNCLDTASRECTTLDHFVVFSSVSCGRGNSGQANYGFSNSVMERICEARARIELPALAIQWGAIGDVGMVMKDLKGHNDTKVGGTLPQRIASCLTSLDFFLGTGATVVASMVLADKETASASASGSLSIVDIVGNILGIKDPKTAGNSTLAELGMDSLMGTEIKQTLEINLDIVMSSQEIRGLSFPQLQELGNNASPSSEKNTQSDMVDNTQVHSHGGMPNAEHRIVPRSSIRKMTSKPSDDTVLPVFMVHPVQGTVELLEEIASIVTRPVWGLECSEGAPMESAQALANHYIEMVKSKQPRGPYTILAYSLGSVFGLEMAIKLEEEGENVSLILLDGSPDFVKGHIDMYVKNQMNKKNLDDFRWPYVTMLFTNMDYSKLKRELEELPTSAERMTRCSGLLGCSEVTFTRAVQLFWRKLEICKAYKPSGKLKSRLRLVKASDNFVTNVGMDYDLSQYCESAVEVITIAGTTHQTIIAGKGAEQVAHLLNAGQ